MRLGPQGQGGRRRILRQRPRDWVMERPRTLGRKPSGVLRQTISSSTALAMVLLAWAACVGAALATRDADTAQAAIAPPGQGFTVTPGDLKFILKQIKIAERHARTLTPANPCGTLVGPGPDQIPDR